MGEYEDRYPEAYGRDEAAAAAAPAPPAANPQPDNRGVLPPGQTRERFSLRNWFGGGAASEPSAAPAPAPAWRHAPARPAALPQQTAAMRMQRDYRGVGPRGYVRSPQRIYEDICDRLTDHPAIDAADIEVQISGVEVTLAGRVADAMTASRAEALAREVPGVKTVRNTLQIRGEADDQTLAERSRRSPPIGIY